MNIVEIISNTITRPADTTPYASGDLVANSTTAGSVTPFTFKIPYGRGLIVYRAGLLRSDVGVTNASFRLHLYKDIPTVTNGDNGAWLSTASGHQGFIDIVGTSPTFSDDGFAYGSYVTNSVFVPFVVLGDTDANLYGLLEARAAYTPTSEGTFILSLIGQAYS